MDGGAALRLPTGVSEPDVTGLTADSRAVQPGFLFAALSGTQLDGKRFVVGSFAPTALLWGIDNRTCSFRVVGHGPSLRFECRIPGGDVNPYLAISALVAAGLRGVEEELPLMPAFPGNAYAAPAARVPTTLHEATDLFERSAVARASFGDEVVDHYVNAARVEIAAFDAAVTDWERYRGFERL